MVQPMIKKRPLSHVSLKKRVVKELTQTFGLKPNNAKVLFEIVVEIMADQLINEEHLTIENFGSMKVIGCGYGNRIRTYLTVDLKRKIKEKKMLDKQNRIKDDIDQESNDI